MNALLQCTIRYHDYREDFYHAFLAGIFASAGYMVDSNKEHGEGRSDVVIGDPINARVAIFEVKYAEYRQVKKDMREYLIAKQTVESILNIDKKKEQEKKVVR